MQTLLELNPHLLNHQSTKNPEVFSTKTQLTSSSEYMPEITP